ncbi:MAG: hypothetical protein Q7R34_05650 [Dehalococcoidia bacterium]|nr:hypothetical protein [Dehalococcoidia bacterium]
MVWHQNVCVYLMPKAGAQEPYATYYDLATAMLSKEGLPVFDIRGDEVREAFVRVALKTRHTVFSGAFGRSG